MHHDGGTIVLLYIPKIHEQQLVPDKYCVLPEAIPQPLVIRPHCISSFYQDAGSISLVGETPKQGKFVQHLMGPLMDGFCPGDVCGVSSSDIQLPAARNLICLLVGQSGMAGESKRIGLL